MRCVVLFSIISLLLLCGCHSSLSPWKIVESWNLRGEGFDEDDAAGLNKERLRRQNSDDEGDGDGDLLGFSNRAREIERNLGR